MANDPKRILLVDDNEDALLILSEVLRIVGHDVAGKTGTAQVISNEGAKAAKGKTEKDLRDNGWFVFFAPRDQPKIAGVVFLEHGVHGTNAAQVARHILDTFFAKLDGQPLPPAPTPEQMRFDFSDPYGLGRQPGAPPAEADEPVNDTH